MSTNKIDKFQEQVKTSGNRTREENWAVKESSTRERDTGPKNRANLEED